MNRLLRSTPRISVNKLAEYMQASARRRRSIIIDQIRPSTAIVIRYDEASRALVRFYRDPDRSTSRLLTAASDLRDKAALIPDAHASQCYLASARAIEAFVPISDRIRPKGLIAVASPKSGAHLKLGGVSISVAPDVSLLEPGTERRVGAMKFHFPRTSKLSTESLQYVATLLYTHLESVGDTPRKGHCYGIDVFSETFETAPRALKDRMKNLEAACEEIAERWSKLYESVAANLGAEAAE